jgi:outer membrane protein OmpA-like peptidoglycan-associated protein
MSIRSIILLAWIVSTALGAAACTHTLVFSDTATLPVVGHPPPAPAPPPPPPPPPPAEPKRVEVQQDQIVIHDKIQFDTDKATIKSESHPLMDEIAQVVQSNPQIKKLSIEGHTDSTGADKRNQQLSEQRAAAVRDYLVQHGVDSARLVSKGWGKSKPISDNATEAGREQNRRVEFLILEQDVVQRTYEVDPKTGAQKDVTTPDTTNLAPAAGGAQ